MANEPRLDPTLESYFLSLRPALVELNATTSNRACILVSVSIVDTALELLLRAEFQKHPDVGKPDCDILLTKRPMPPLGSTAIRARCAFAMGLIDRTLMKAILAVIDIRNEHAHSLSPTTLSDDATKQLYGRFPGIVPLPLAAQPVPIDAKARHEFITFCIALSVKLIHERLKDAVKDWGHQSQSSDSVQSMPDINATTLDSIDSSPQTPRSASGT